MRFFFFEHEGQEYLGSFSGDLVEGGHSHPNPNGVRLNGGERELLASMVVQNPAITPNQAGFRSGQAMLVLNNGAAASRQVVANGLRKQKKNLLGELDIRDIQTFEKHLDELDKRQNQDANLPQAKEVSLQQQQQKVNIQT